LAAVTVRTQSRKIIFPTSRMRWRYEWLFAFLPLGAVPVAHDIVSIAGASGWPHVTKSFSGNVAIGRRGYRCADTRLLAEDRNHPVIIQPLARPAGRGGGGVDGKAVRGIRLAQGAPVSVR